MKVVDFDGRTHNWPAAGYVVALNDKRNRSELHLRVRSLLHSLYPTQPILEEVLLAGTRFFVDFYLPSAKLAVECHGEQHYSYNPHFFVDRRAFAQSCNRDQKKLEWFRMNNIRVAILPYNQKDEEFIRLIEEAE